MVSTGFVLFSTALVVTHCSGKHIERSEETYPSLHDDIRLTPEQQEEMKERGFYTAAKWPKVKGVVVVPYYFDTSAFPVGDSFRADFKAVIDIYESQTCIDWVEVSQTDKRHKIKVTEQEGCWSNMGMTSGAEQILSLSNGCKTTWVMLHEMGHSLGLYHTHTRSDRDQYVKFWPQFVRPGQHFNFDKNDGAIFNVPYDYKSMMHFKNDFYSRNGSFTLTTSDPFALFSIGPFPKAFRYSDAALLNKGYSCITEFTAKCGEKNCLNGGFVGKDCKCRCPENTSGNQCETVNGPFFFDKPCGRNITTPGNIQPPGFPIASLEVKCVYAIKAPDCKLPAIKITTAKFQRTYCTMNRLSIQVSPVTYGYTWCDQADIPVGKTIVSETQTANIFYEQLESNLPGYGFRANVQFVDDPKCTNKP